MDAKHGTLRLTEAAKGTPVILAADHIVSVVGVAEVDRAGNRVMLENGEVRLVGSAVELTTGSGVLVKELPEVIADQAVRSKK